MTLPEIEVSDTPWTWLSIYAENYVAADRLNRQLLNTLDRTDLDPATRRGAEAHLQEVKHRRQQAYSSLVAAAMECETARLAPEPT